MRTAYLRPLPAQPQRQWPSTSEEFPWAGRLRKEGCRQDKGEAEAVPKIACLDDFSNFVHEQGMRLWIHVTELGPVVEKFISVRCDSPIGIVFMGSGSVGECAR